MAFSLAVGDFRGGRRDLHLPQSHGPVQDFFYLVDALCLVVLARAGVHDLDYAFAACYLVSPSAQLGLDDILERGLDPGVEDAGPAVVWGGSEIEVVVVLSGLCLGLGVVLLVVV